MINNLFSKFDPQISLQISNKLIVPITLVLANLIGLIIELSTCDQQLNV